MSEPFETDKTLAITNQRRFSHPKTRLFEAFANPDLLKTWWGPKGFSSTFQQFDFRPGGDWVFVLHGPEGTDYDNHITFLEISIPHQIVMHHHGPVHEFRIAVSYESVEETGGDETRVTWHMVSKMELKTAEAKAQFTTFIEAANEENLDRLEACLSEMAKRRS